MAGSFGGHELSAFAIRRPARRAERQCHSRRRPNLRSADFRPGRTAQARGVRGNTAPVRLRRNLQGPALVPEAVVVADCPLHLQAEGVGREYDMMSPILPRSSRQGETSSMAIDIPRQQESR